MSDVEVSRTESLTRQEAARRLSTLAAALADGGRVEVDLGGSTLKLRVPDQVRCEVEVEVDGNEVELELEMTWSMRPPPAPAESPAAESPATETPDTAETPDAADTPAEPAPAKAAAPVSGRTSRRARGTAR